MPGYGKSEVKVPPKWQSKQKITDEQVVGLAKLGIRLEKHYYFPQDIEWAIEKNKLYIVQTRPITTIKKDMKETEQDTVKELKKLHKLAEGSGASPGIVSGPVTIIKSASQIHKIKEGDILVAEQTNPDYVPAMKKAAAIVTAKGGRTSHAAIVSRELGTPAVVGAETILKVVHDTMLITVDGGSGIVYKGSLQKQFQTEDASVPSTVTFKTATKVYINLAEVERAEEVSKLNVDGVGLLRAEFMLAGIGVHPKWVISEHKEKQYIKELAYKISIFCKAFGHDRPVVYRTTDFKTNEYKNLKHGHKYEEDEENPMLGYRGAARYVQDSDVFELELQAIKMVRQKMGYKNLHVMIPFVRTPQQLLETKKIMGSVGLMRTPSFKLWMMVEIPANVISLDEFLKVGIDGVSIGSNDLTQLILGVDRDNSKIAQYFSELNPAVLWALEKVVKTCHKAHVTVSLCGQAASDYPQLVEKLVEWGITSVSVNPDAVDKTRLAIYEAEKKHIRRK
jgi:pyruvate,water dikinase